MERRRKRATAVVFGYNGLNFNGSQKQPNAQRTVEAELENALFTAGFITEANYGDLHKINWTRASRTDKGVHALRTVISLRALLTDEPLESQVEALNEKLPDDIRVFQFIPVVNSFNAKHQASYREYSYFFPAHLLPDEAVEGLNKLTKKFIGSKKYHNFSRDIEPASAEAKRYIIKFEASKIIFEDISFVRLDVTGQSFLYHQIRSMVGILVHTILGKLPETAIDEAFQDEARATPLAPAEGLCLSWVHFQAYNRKNPQKPIELLGPLVSKSDEFFSVKVKPSIVEAERQGIFASWLAS